MEDGRKQLLEILLQVGFDYGRTHVPEKVFSVQEELGLK